MELEMRKSIICGMILLIIVWNICNVLVVILILDLMKTFYFLISYTQLIFIVFSQVIEWTRY